MFCFSSAFFLFKKICIQQFKEEGRKESLIRHNIQVVLAKAIIENRISPPAFSINRKMTSFVL